MKHHSSLSRLICYTDQPYYIQMLLLALDCHLSVTNDVILLLIDIHPNQLQGFTCIKSRHLFTCWFVGKYKVPCLSFFTASP